MEGLINLGFFVGLVATAYFVGKHIESRHYAAIEAREQELMNMPTLTSRKCYAEDNIAECYLVMGNVVISGDYFKMVLASILKIFGGRIVGYESLMDRGRREAILRMKEEAKVLGANAVINMRFEMSKLDGMVNQKGTGMFEIMAYGTAIKTRHG